MKRLLVNRKHTHFFQRNARPINASVYTFTFQPTRIVSKHTSKHNFTVQKHASATPSRQDRASQCKRQFSSSAEIKTIPLKKALRLLYLKIHPDKLSNTPYIKQMQTNEQNFGQLMAFLDDFEAPAHVHIEERVIALTFFWLDDDEQLCEAHVHLRIGPGLLRSHQHLLRSIQLLLQRCGMDDLRIDGAQLQRAQQRAYDGSQPLNVGDTNERVHTHSLLDVLERVASYSRRTTAAYRRVEHEADFLHTAFFMQFGFRIAYDFVDTHEARTRAADQENEQEARLHRLPPPRTRIALLTQLETALRTAGIDETPSSSAMWSHVRVPHNRNETFDEARAVARAQPRAERRDRSELSDGERALLDASAALARARRGDDAVQEEERNETNADVPNTNSLIGALRGITLVFVDSQTPELFDERGRVRLRRGDNSMQWAQSLYSLRDSANDGDESSQSKRQHQQQRDKALKALSDAVATVFGVQSVFSDYATEHGAAYRHLCESILSDADEIRRWRQRIASTHRLSPEALSIHVEARDDLAVRVSAVDGTICVPIHVDAAKLLDAVDRHWHDLAVAHNQWRTDLREAEHKCVLLRRRFRLLSVRFDSTLPPHEVTATCERLLAAAPQLLAHMWSMKIRIARTYHVHDDGTLSIPHDWHL